jgi:hypothetical protein
MSRIVVGLLGGLLFVVGAAITIGLLVEGNRSIFGLVTFGFIAIVGLVVILISIFGKKRLVDEVLDSI